MPQKDNATMHAAKGNDEKGKKLGGICYCRQTLQVIREKHAKKANASRASL